MNICMDTHDRITGHRQSVILRNVDLGKPSIYLDVKKCALSEYVKKKKIGSASFSKNRIYSPNSHNHKIWQHNALILLHNVSIFSVIMFFCKNCLSDFIHVEILYLQHTNTSKFYDYSFQSLFCNLHTLSTSN
jgi:hypothetical protein